jgi:hypothetical protein
MVPVFEGKKLAGWTGWDPAVRKREVGDEKGVSPTQSHIFDFYSLF